MPIRTLTLVALLAGRQSLAAQTSPSPATIEHRLRGVVHIADRPDTAFDLLDRMRLYRVPGVSIAVIDSFRVVFAKGYGVVEYGGGMPVDSTTLFLAGSISKPVFATGALRLVEQGKLNLDEDVNHTLKSWHLPESRFTEHEKVTLRRLLTHSAGLTVWGFPGYAMTAAVPTVPQLLDGVPPANTPAVRNDTTPGARWLYSGGGMTIAQLMTTDVTGEPFPALMRRLVLTPAGMTRSTYENPLPVGRRKEAASGHETLDTPVVGKFHVYPEMAAAGLWTTASDLARWAISLSHSYRGELGGVLSPAMARQMVSKQMAVKPPYGSGFWGLGVGVAGDGDSLTFMHDGRDEGFVATLVMWPNRGRGLVVMMNGVNGELMAEIARAFGEAYGLPGPTRVERSVSPLGGATLASFAGRYAQATPKDTIMLEVTASTANGGSLRMTDPLAGRVHRLLPQGGDSFFDADGGGKWHFERVAGTPRTLIGGAGQSRRVAVRQ